MLLANFILVFATSVLPIAYAQILPKAEKCGDFFVEQAEKDFKKLKSNSAFKDENRFDAYVKDNGREGLSNVLGCAVKYGRIRLFMMPFFITYLVQFLLSLAGLIAVLFVVYGGYKYVVGGLVEDKESGKKAMLHALLGLIVALSAWIIVNFIQVALTS